MCLGCAGTPLATCRSQRILPVLNSTSYTIQRCGADGVAISLNVIVPPLERETYFATGSSGSSSTLMAVVTKTWSSQTIGELHDRPGTSIFQMMFCDGPQTSGSIGSSAA